MNSSEAKLFLNCNEKDLDCYQNEVFQSKQQLLSKYIHPKVLEKISQKLFQKHLASKALGFEEHSESYITKTITQNIISINDLTTAYRLFEKNESYIKLEISKARHFIQLFDLVKLLILNEQERNKVIHDSVFYILSDFKPDLTVKKSTSIMTGEIINYLSGMNKELKINEKTCHELLNSSYIYTDFSKIFLEFNS